MVSDQGGGGGGSIFSEPEGSPEAMHAIAARLRSAATGVHPVGAGITRAMNGLSDWKGFAKDKATSYAASMTRLYDALPGPLEGVAGALETLGDALTAARHKIGVAKESYDRANADARRIVAAVNCNPERTQGDVAAAQAELDRLRAIVDAAVEDAQAAWRAYRLAQQSAVQTIAAQTGSLSDVPAARELSWLDTYTALTGANDKFVATTAVPDVFRSLAVDELKKAGGWDKEKGWTKLQSLENDASGLETRIQVLKEMGKDGLTEADMADLLDYEGRLPGATRAVQGAGIVKGAATTMEVVGKGVAVAGLVSDVNTVINPAHDGVRGDCERGAALVNGGLIVASAFAPVPVVGEAVMVGTGLYLAADWAYDNIQPFHDFVDNTWDHVKSGWGWLSDKLSQQPDPTTVTYN